MLLFLPNFIYVKAAFLTAVFCGLVMIASGQANDNPVQEKRIIQMICGHRGGLYENLPENSFSAIDFTFRNCHSSPVIIEFDVRKSKDGTLFLLHDETVDRTTNGTGKIAELPDAYLKSLFLKKANGNLTKDRIPTYDSLLRYARTKSIVLMLDIKADVWDEAIERIIQEKLVHKSIVLTFIPKDSKKVFELSNTIKISCLIRNENEWNAIRDLSIPLNNLIAYISESTSQNLIGILKNNMMLIMADMNENVIKNTNPLHGKRYREFVKKRRLDILITDFPVEVSKKLK